MGPNALAFSAQQLLYGAHAVLARGSWNGGGLCGQKFVKMNKEITVPEAARFTSGICTHLMIRTILGDPAVHLALLRLLFLGRGVREEQ